MAIQNLPRKSAEYEIAVREHRGLVVRVHPSGARSFVYRFRQDRTLKRVALQAATLAEARKEWDGLAGKVKSGHDPAEAVKREKAVKQLKRQADRADPTFATLAEDFIRLYAKKRKRSWRADELMLQRLAVPELGNIKVREIRRRDVIALVEKVAHKAPIRANRLLAVVRKLFAWAVERDVLEISPCGGVKAPSVEVSRDRVLSDDELRAFWGALPESGLPADTAIALRLQLLTACRIGEIVGAEWSEFDLKKAEWLIPGKRSKNKRECLLPLSEAAVELLETRPTSDAYVFPRPGKKTGHLRTDVATHELAEASFGIEERFTSHDLRRTVATNLGALAVPRVVQDGILNHKDRTIGATYDRYAYLPEKRAALEAWAHRLHEVVGGKTRTNVVSINGKAAA